MINLEQLKQRYEQGKFGDINNQVMIDTKELCESNKRLIYSIGNSISTCLIVYEDNDIKVFPKPGNTQIIVSNRRSYETAKIYKGKKVAVLDFANNHVPGGAPFRAGAQEESLCRCSTLYPCLFGGDNYELFYQRHIDQFNHGEIDWKGNDDIMYFKDIIVFKTDEDIPQLMNKGEWYNVDVIVSAAPQAMDINSDLIVLETVLKKRIKRILDMAYLQKVEILILGAYGCGAFCNPPELVAKIFRDELKNYDFKIVEFPIFWRDNYGRNNRKVFNDVFSDRSVLKYDLSKFKLAQRIYYETALNEIQNGNKQTHRIRYIFPQIAGLGHSEMTQKYAISCLEEAIEYYNDDELKNNLLDISQALLDLDGNNPELVLGGIDAMKVKSCMTLFHQVDPKNRTFIDVLNKYYHGELDEKTLEILCG